MKNKKHQSIVLNLIIGLIIIGGGLSIIFNYINLGFFLTTLGPLTKILELTIIGELK